MKDPRQFGGNKPATGAGGAAGKEASGSFDCSTVELWLADWADGALAAAILEQIDGHAKGCAACREKLAQARRGREWLLVLKQEALEPPAGLVGKILARTSLAGMANATVAVSGRSIPEAVKDKRAEVFSRKIADGEKGRSEDVDYVSGDDSAAASIPAWQQSSVVVLRRTFIEPRLILVAAMAFFSIAVTMNLLGVRPTRLHVTDLTPKNMHRAVTRQYAEVNARVVRYYENLRIVYEVEAQVQQLRRAAESTVQPQQQTKPRKQSSDSNRDSSDGLEGSDRNFNRGLLTDNPGSRNPLFKGGRHSNPPIPDPRPITTGPRMDASLEWPQRINSAECIAAAGKPRNPSLSTPADKNGPPETPVRSGLQEIYRSRLQEISINTKVAIAFQPALPASSCPPDTLCFSMRYFSTRERRLA